MAAPVQIEDPDDDFPLFPDPDDEPLFAGRMAPLNLVPPPVAMMVPLTPVPVIILYSDATFVAPPVPPVPVGVHEDEDEEDEDEYADVDDGAIECVKPTAEGQSK